VPIDRASTADYEDLLRYVDTLERERDALQIEYESRAIWIAEMCAILGYQNEDGFHSEPDPFTIARSLVADRDALLARVETQRECIDAQQESIDDLTDQIAVLRERAAPPANGAR